MKIILSLLFSLFTLSTQAATLSWSANTISSDVRINTTGYKVYYGPSSGNYNGSYDVGNVTSAPIINNTGAIAYVAITAYNAARVESKPSNEIVLALPTPIPTPTSTPTPAGTPVQPQNFHIVILGGTVTVTGVQDRTFWKSGRSVFASTH